MPTDDVKPPELRIYVGEQPAITSEMRTRYPWRAELPDGSEASGISMSAVSSASYELLRDGRVSEGTVVRVIRGGCDVFMPQLVEDWARTTYSEGDAGISVRRFKSWQERLESTEARLAKLKKPVVEVFIPTD
jgi:hypothetical protein